MFFFFKFSSGHRGVAKEGEGGKEEESFQKGNNYDNNYVPFTNDCVKKCVYTGHEHRIKQMFTFRACTHARLTTCHSCYKQTIWGARFSIQPVFCVGKIPGALKNARQ